MPTESAEGRDDLWQGGSPHTLKTPEQRADAAKAEWNIWQEANRRGYMNISHTTFQLQRGHAYAQLVLDFLEKAVKKHPPMNTPHEGYAVILEEVDELWDEVKKQSGGHGPEAVKEALQVAAMAIRFILDTVPPSRDADMTDALRGR